MTKNSHTVEFILYVIIIVIMIFRARHFLSIAFGIACPLAHAELLVLHSASEINDFLRKDVQSQASFTTTGVIERANIPAVVSDATGHFEVHEWMGDGQRPSVGDKTVLSGNVFVTKNLEPWILVKSFDVIGSEAPKAPLRVPLKDLSTLKHNHLLVATEGQVIDALPDSVDERVAFLLVKDHSSILPVACNEKQSPKQLIGAYVRITGFFHASLNSRRIFTGPYIYLTDLKVLIPSPDPFTSPKLGNPHYLSPAEVIKMDQRVITGTIDAVWDGSEAILRMSSGEFVRCRFQQGQELPRIGQAVDVVGRANTDLFRICLRQARWRPSAFPPATNATPAKISVREICRNNGSRTVYRTDYFGKPVTIQGTVRMLSLKGDEPLSMAVESEGQLIPIKCEPSTRPFANLKIGFELKVTGVCILETEAWQPDAIFPQTTGVFLVVRTPQDIEVVSRPSWWTPLRLWVLVGILFLALIASFSVAVFLRRLVDRRGRELMREQLAHYAAKLRVGERTRLAVELHDTLSQNLSGVGLQISAAKGAKALGAEAMAERLETAERMLQSSRMELKRCLFDLRSDALGKADFADAIGDTLKPILGAARLTLRFNIPRAKLHDTTAHAVICIVRELVSNAIQHGKATAVHVAGSLEDGTLLFSVKDNGTGFDPPSSPGPLQGHFGLSGIRERTERLGGTFTIKSTPGTGTYARVSVDAPTTGATEGPCL